MVAEVDEGALPGVVGPQDVNEAGMREVLVADGQRPEPTLATRAANHDGFERLP